MSYSQVYAVNTGNETGHVSRETKMAPAGGNVNVGYNFLFCLNGLVKWEILKEMFRESFGARAPHPHVYFGFKKTITVRLTA